MIPKHYYTAITPDNPRKRYTYLDPVFHEEIFTLRRQGLTLKTIGEKYGVSSNTIKLLCANNHVYPIHVQPSSHYFWFKERKDELAMMWNRGDSISDIAAHFGKSESAISSHLSILKTEGYHIINRHNGVRYARTGGIYINGQKV